MREPSPIDTYIETLERELSFDMELSRRVRTEVEDHLSEAAAARSGPSPEAQRRAIENFGDPRDLARQYIAASLLAQVRRSGAVTVLGLIGIFVMMKARVAWYGFTQWESSQSLKMVSAIGLPIDRYAFMLALIIALIGCLYIGARRVPAEFGLAYSKEIKRCMVLCGAVAGALLVAIFIETVLTAIRLWGAGVSAAALVPTLSLAVEIAIATVLIRHVRATIRRATVAFLASP